MRYVLDTSVALKWELLEADSDKAIRLRDETRRGLHQLHAPDVFPAEFAHAITRAERQGRITSVEGAQAIADILLELPALHSSVILLPRAYTISSVCRIGVYDGLYVALAEREGWELITADVKLNSTLGKQFPCIVSLASLP